MDRNTNGTIDNIEKRLNELVDEINLINKRLDELDSKETKEIKKIKVHNYEVV